MYTLWNEHKLGRGRKVLHQEQEERQPAFSHCQTLSDDSGLMTLRPVTQALYSMSMPFCACLLRVASLTKVTFKHNALLNFSYMI